MKEQSSTSKIHLPNKELVGIKKEKEITKIQTNYQTQLVGGY